MQGDLDAIGRVPGTVVRAQLVGNGLDHGGPDVFGNRLAATIVVSSDPQGPAGFEIGQYGGH